jgi:hypothetical protein
VPNNFFRYGDDGGSSAAHVCLRPECLLESVLSGTTSMLRAAIIAMGLLVSLPLFGAEMRFKRMRLPPDVHVQIEGSTARVSGQQLGIETIWNCSCTGEGSCTIQNNTGVLACYKGTGDTCKADCFLSFSLGGLFGSPGQ